MLRSRAIRDAVWNSFSVQRSLTTLSGGARWQLRRDSFGSRHWFSTSLMEQPVRILWASQTGTSQIFCQQLSDGLEDEVPELQVSVQGLHESRQPQSMLTPGDALHVFVVSVTGVGEPPDNARKFYEWLMDEKNKESGEIPDMSTLKYAVFGCGNKQAHPNHFNVIGINLDKRLEELGGQRIMDIGLGDDGDCIEDDFDVWMDSLMKLIKEGESADSTPAEAEEAAAMVEEKAAPVEDESLRAECPPGVATSEDGKRRISKKYATMNLREPVTDVIRADLFHLQGTKDQFYSDNSGQLDVVSNHLLTPDAGETGIHEIKVNMRDHNGHRNIPYRTGDHLLVYPRNSDSMVQAYLDILDVDPHAVIDEEQAPSYPYPKGLTVYETLSHCVDLGAIPSPAFSRILLGRKELEYKNEIATPRRTVVDILREHDKNISLEDLLYNLVPMKSRYYSIASSSTKEPHEIRLSYRPVKYMTNRGVLREGLCTNYMSHKGVIGTLHFAHVAAAVNSNPAFRLPPKPETEIIFIAGGCGVAPIRAFVEERMVVNKPNYGAAQVYLGFRNPEDEVYAKFFQDALEQGVLSDVKVAYSGGCTDESQYCMNVNKLVRHDSNRVWEMLESGCHIYLCGGARTFGAAIEHELLEIIQEHGKMDFAAAEDYMRNLLETGRLLEDLAD